MEYICIALSLGVIILTVFVIILAMKISSGKDVGIKKELIENRQDSSRQMKENRQELAENIARLSSMIDEKFENQNRRIDIKLSQVETKNEKSIKEIRETVDENLHKTLEEKITQSFKTVNEQLEQVYKGLGEMQGLAAGVGDLKKVLTNVKNRGVWGELQLERLLGEILSSEQYVKNAVTKEGSGQLVEFAVKMPGNGESVLLPIDSKFPIESYSRLLEAYETAPEQIESCAKELEDAVKKSAKDISEKYINPPYTTDYAVMFLPIEGLYCEVARRSGLIEHLTNKYRVVISGPTTLTALLNSLQMGFRTAHIEKQAEEIWLMLSRVREELLKFDDVLDKTKKNISAAGNNLDKLSTRTRVALKQLTLHDNGKDISLEGENEE